MRKVSVSYQEKYGKMWYPTWYCEDSFRTYKDLSNELIAKKINGCSWIKKIVRKQHYDGFIDIIIYYDHGGRKVYTVKD